MNGLTPDGTYECCRCCEEGVDEDLHIVNGEDWHTTDCSTCTERARQEAWGVARAAELSRAQSTIERLRSQIAVPLRAFDEPLNYRLALQQIIDEHDQTEKEHKDA